MKINAMHYSILSAMILCLFTMANASVLPPDLGLNNSPSQSLGYDARSTFINPAALGFETALNGGQFLSSFEFGNQRSFGNAHSIAVALGSFGFGIEEIPVSDGALTRYSFGLGFSLTSELYFGIRERLFRGNSPSLSGINALDLSFQFRPFHWLSVGGTANALNSPNYLGENLQATLAFGLTVRPVDLFDISFDMQEVAKNEWKGALRAVFKPLNGLHLEAGYHQTHGAQFGLRLILGATQTFGYDQGSAEVRRVVGFDFAPLPYRRALKSAKTIRLRIRENLSESGVEPTFFDPGKPSLIEILRALEEARLQPEIELVQIQLDSMPLGFASVMELYNSLSALRAAGKKVHAYLGQAGLREFLIASTADRIMMEPSGELRLTGLSIQRYFLKGTLEKIGVEGEFLARGDYKSAPEMFSRRESSPLSKSASLEEMRRAEVIIRSALMSQGRMTTDKWTRVLSQGVFSPEMAKQEGLIDEVASFGLKNPRPLPSDSIDFKKDDLALRERIAVIPLAGDILEEQGITRLGSTNAITPEKVEALIRAANSDSLTRAIILRITSPGGEVLASRKIAGIIERSKIPVYVSMGDVAASGGYMIAAPSKKIFASPLTYTGSIGVFLGKPNLSGLYQKIDLHKEILTDAPLAALNSEHKPWSVGERKIMSLRLNQYYEEFTSYVGTHRNLGANQVEAAAQGRVWLGASAKDQKLVDELGGVIDAVKSVAKLENMDRYEMDILRPALGFMDLLRPTLLTSAASSFEKFAEVGASALDTSELRWAQSLHKNPILYWEPSQLTDR